MFHYLWPSERFDFKLTRRGLSFAFKCGAVCLHIQGPWIFFLFNYLFTLAPYQRGHHQPPIIQVHLAPFIFVLPHCAGKIYIRPTIHLAVHWMSCCDIFYVILSKVQPTWFNINHTLPCCGGALQPRSETVDSCERPAGYEYTLSWARADDMMCPHSGPAAYYISNKV